MFYRLKYLITLFVLIVHVLSVSAVSSDVGIDNTENSKKGQLFFEYIMERIRKDYYAQIDLDETLNKTENILSIIRKDGSLPNINYADREKAIWDPLNHLDAILTLAVAYSHENSNYYGNSNVYGVLLNMLNFWHTKHFTSDNWYYQQIACPQRIGLILILLKTGKEKNLSLLEKGLLERMKMEGGHPDQQGALGAGANKIDIATHWIYRSCLTSDEDLLLFSVNQAYIPIDFSIEEGLQHDFSYFQHGHQLYIGGYGYTVINRISKIAQYMVDTPYALSADRLERLSAFVRGTYLKVIRGQNMLYNVLGRNMSRKNEIKQQNFTHVLLRMQELDPSNKDEYEYALKRLTMKESANYMLTPVNKYFWRAEYALHQRPKFTVDVRGSSVYTCRSENGNGENLKGYFLVDGATAIARTGNEYIGVFPVWDWAKIPGVTCPDIKQIPLPKSWEVSGTSTFSGGLSTGVYGMSTYQLNDTNFGINTTARKSWFFFDNEIVCVGSGINSTNENVINTTVNQCKLGGSIVVSDGENVQEFSNGVHSLKNTLWVLHDSIGYFFPAGGDLGLTNKQESGSWYSINKSLSKDTVCIDMFKLWINHGLKPVQAGYFYLIVPGMQSKAEASKYHWQDIQLLSNSNSIHAVYHKSQDIMGIVFYEKTKFTHGKVKISVSRPCVMLIEDVNKPKSRIHLSDPSRKGGLFSLTIKLPHIKKQNMVCEFISHPHPEAGKTYSYSITN